MRYRSAEALLLKVLGEQDAGAPVKASLQPPDLAALSQALLAQPHSLLVLVSVLQRRARPGPGSGPVDRLLLQLNDALQQSPIAVLVQVGALRCSWSCCNGALHL